MSEHHPPDLQGMPREGGVFKSSETTPQKMNEFTNSAVSDTAVDRAPDEPHTDEVFAGDTPDAERDRVYLGAEPDKSKDEVFVGAPPDQPVDPAPLDEATKNLQKIDALVQEAEQRRQQLDVVYQEAEQILEKVNEISKAMVLNDDLRDRLNRTVLRTKTLRGGMQKMEG